MIDKHYRAVSTGLGIMVVSCSSISAALLLDAPPPDGLRVLDPVATKTTVLVLLAVLGVVLPMLAVLRPLKPVRVNATVFAAAAMTNAVALSPMIVVPFQGATSLIAVICAIGMAAASTPTLHDSVEPNPECEGPGRSD